MTTRDSAAECGPRTDSTPVNFAFMTLEEEALGHGWTRITKPVGGEPAPAPMVGMRGEPDFDNDQTYGF